MSSPPGCPLPLQPYSGILKPMGDYATRLQEVAPHIQLVEYVPAKKGKSVFFDTERHLEFKYYYFPLLKRFSDAPDFVPCPTTEDKATIYSVRSEKSRRTCLEKYGVENVSQVPAVKTAKEKTLYKNHGVSHPSKSAKLLAKKNRQCLEKYGVENVSQLASTKAKRAKTFQKYENGHPLKDPTIRSKQRETAIKNGTIRVVKGSTLKELADKHALHYQTVSQKYTKYGEGGVLSLGVVGTALEHAVLNLPALQDEEVVCRKQLTDTAYRPDFLLPSHRLVIECDGLYWHSDAQQKDRQYHAKKLAAYREQGYRALFFRSDEVSTRPAVVDSIITNAVKKNDTKLFARKLLLEKIDSRFFEDHHLMGKGAGPCLGLVNERGTVVCGIQTKWVRRGDLLDISRFCTAPKTTVAGGFSRLLTAVERVYQPQQIQTFVDLRYGTGHYLSSLGFEHAGTHLSFKWTDGNRAFGRMQFPKNSGYDYGFHKIWDCGQSRWTKDIERK